MTEYVVTSFTEADRARAWCDQRRAELDVFQARLPSWLQPGNVEDRTQLQRHANRVPFAKLRRHQERMRELSAGWEQIGNVMQAVVTFAKTWEPLIDYARRRYVDRQQFFDSMSEPGQPNEMDFVLRRDPEREGSFSVEGFQAVAYQMHDFALARTLGRWGETGEPPRNMRVRVSLSWDEPDDTVTDAALARDNVPPWYSLDDDDHVGGTMLTLDGSTRLSAFLDQLDALGKEPTS